MVARSTPGFGFARVRGRFTCSALGVEPATSDLGRFLPRVEGFSFVGEFARCDLVWETAFALVAAASWPRSFFLNLKPAALQCHRKQPGR